MLAKGGKKKGGNSKAKGDKTDKKCGNCRKKGHTDENCFAPGGGKEKEAPEWWKKKFGDEKGKEKEMKGKTANVAEEKESTEENYAFLIDTENLVLVCTSDFQEEASRLAYRPEASLLIAVPVHISHQIEINLKTTRSLQHFQFGQPMAVLLLHMDVAK